jgi:1-acyl-sn-glycerol-3-phosphate acyltransferase
MHWVYYFGRILIHFLVFPFAWWKIRGKENLPEKGPLLIICNHLSIADPPIVAASIKLRCVVMGKSELFEHRWSRFWIKNFGTFPVRRNSFDREALRQTENWINKGISVIMFPEGGRAKSGKLEKGLPGAALLASRLGVPVLPVAITETDNFEERMGWMIFHRPTVTVTIGKPFKLENEGKLDRSRRNELIDGMMMKIAELLPENYRGVYGRKTGTGN